MVLQDTNGGVAGFIGLYIGLYIALYKNYVINITLENLYYDYSYSVCDLVSTHMTFMLGAWEPFVGKICLFKHQNLTQGLNVTLGDAHRN